MKMHGDLSHDLHWLRQTSLNVALKQQKLEEGAKLDQQIAENLRRLGYEF